MKQKVSNILKKGRPLGAFQKYLLRSLGFLAVAAIFLTWFLEYRYFINNSLSTWNFIYNSPIVFLFNAFLLFLGLVFLWGIFNKPGTAVGFMWVALIIISYIHINKYNSRETPLLPEDFELADQASSLTNFVQFGSLIRLILAIALVIILTVLFNRILAKKLKIDYHRDVKNFMRRHLVGERLIILIISGFLLVSTTAFARHHDGSRYSQIPFLGTQFTAWNQNRNYDENGFILGFLYNMQKLQLQEPEEYSESAIADIKQQYDNIAKKENKSRTNPKKDDVSVVVILNESFYDPDVSFNGKQFRDYYHYEGEIMPNLHRIQSQYPSGNMYSLDYGGGTANIEFETFTSLSNYWINAVPYTSLVPKAGDIPSIAQYLKSKNFATTAIHPYNGGMYKRNISLQNEGFDTFITQSEMKHTEHDGVEEQYMSKYINDKSAYAETLDTLKSSGKNQMIGLITMQNHTPYTWETYGTNEFIVTNDNIPWDKGHTIETYFQSLHQSDQYLGDFISELDKLDKKVVVLFFGDHSAGLFDLVNSNSEKKIRDLSRVTPYFFYANFDNAFVDNSDLPTTTPNCMVNTLYNRLNWQKESYYYLVDQVCSEEPILTATYLEDRDLKQSLILKKYELLTYDILGGKQYWLNK